MVGVGQGAVNFRMEGVDWSWSSGEDPVENDHWISFSLVSRRVPEESSKTIFIQAVQLDKQLAVIGKFSGTVRAFLNQTCLKGRSL